MIIKQFRNNGYTILAVLLTAVGIITAIGIWMLSGNNNIKDNYINISDSDKIAAASLMHDMTNLRNAVTNLQLQGYNPNNMTFMPGDTSPFNILNTNTGTVYPIVSKNTFRKGITSPEGIWVFNKNHFFGKGVGIDAVADPILYIAGIKDNICWQINILLEKQDTIPFTTAVSTSAGTVTGATITNPNSNATINLTTGTTFKTNMAGCYSFNFGEDQNVLYFILKAN